MNFLHESCLNPLSMFGIYIKKLAGVSNKEPLILGTHVYKNNLNYWRKLLKKEEHGKTRIKIAKLSALHPNVMKENFGKTF